MRKRIQEQLTKHKTLVSNFGYLSALQVFSMLVPLITLPYLIKVLGKETYGLIIFAQVIISYFVIIINFGFNLSVTKEISIHRNNKEKLSEIVSSVYIIKGILFFISLGLLYIVLHFIPQAEGYKTLFYLMMYMCLYEWMFPIWYFQGIEKMKYITFLNLVSRGVFLLLIFILVKKQENYTNVPIINGIGTIIVSIISMYLIFIKYNINFKWQNIHVLKRYFKDSLPLFIGNIAGSIKIISNKTILGMFLGMETVAIYDIADKINQVFLSFLQITVSVIFPNVSKTKNTNIIKKSLKGLIIIGTIIYLSISILGNLVTNYYFIDYKEVIEVFWILGLVLILQPASYLIGTGVLIVNNMKKEYSMNLNLMNLIYLSMIIMCYYFYEINIYSLSFVLSSCISLEFFIRIFLCKKYGLIKWIK